MNKAVYVGGVLIALALMAGSIWAPSSLEMTFVSSSLAAVIGRGIIVTLMAVLIFTNPPRSQVVRRLLFMASIGFAYWAIANALSGTIHLVDSFLYLQVAVALAVEALESSRLTFGYRDPDNELENAQLRGATT